MTMFFSILGLIANLSFFEQPLFIKETDVFQTISSHKVCVNPSQNLYIADTRGWQILRYNNNGKRLNSFGGQGQGPADFKLLTYLQYFDKKLYAFDWMDQLIKVFREDGTFIETIKAPRSVFNYVVPGKKIQSGWIFRDWEKQSIIWADDHFRSHKFLSGQPVEDIFKSHLTYGAKRKYNPAPDKSLFGLSHDRSKIFTYVPGEGFKIRVFDAASLELLWVIEKDFAPLPFIEAWGDERFDRFLANQKPQRRGLYEKSFPEFFPAILHLSSDYWGNLRVHRGNVYLDDDKSPLILNEKGEPLSEPALAQKDYLGIVAYQKPWFYISQYQDDELGIARVGEADIFDFFRKRSAH